MVSAMNSGLRGPGLRGLAHWPRRVNVLCSWTRHYSHCTGRQATASHTLAYGWLPPPIHPHTHTPSPPPSHFVKFTWIHPSEQIRTGELLTCYIIYNYIVYILYIVIPHRRSTTVSVETYVPLLRLNTKRITGLLSFYFQSLVEGLKIKSSKSSSLLTDISECPETEAVANTLWLVTNSKSCPNCK